MADVVFPPAARYVSQINARLARGTFALTWSITLLRVALEVLLKGTEEMGRGSRKAMRVARNTTRTVGTVMQSIT